MSRLESLGRVALRAGVPASLALSVILSLLAPIPASAQGFYLGGSGLWLQPGEASSDLGDWGYSVLAGYETPGWIGVEAGYLDWSGSGAAGSWTVREELDLAAFLVAGTARVDFDSSFTPYAKLGWLFWTLDTRLSDDAQFIPQSWEYSTSGEDPFIAVGVGLDMGRGTTAFSELARYEIGDAAFNSASLGLRVHW